MIVHKQLLVNETKEKECLVFMYETVRLKGNNIV